jgi:hypothetical protein
MCACFKNLNLITKIFVKPLNKKQKFKFNHNNYPPKHPQEGLCKLYSRRLLLLWVPVLNRFLKNEWVGGGQWVVESGSFSFK